MSTDAAAGELADTVVEPDAGAPAVPEQQAAPDAAVIARAEQPEIEFERIGGVGRGGAGQNGERRP